MFGDVVKAASMDPTSPMRSSPARQSTSKIHKASRGHVEEFDEELILNYFSYADELEAAVDRDEQTQHLPSPSTKLALIGGGGIDKHKDDDNDDDDDDNADAREDAASFCTEASLDSVGGGWIEEWREWNAVELHQGLGGC